MGKKVLYILLMLLLGVIARTPSIHAEKKPYWTYQEIQEFLPVVKDEIYNNECETEWCFYERWQDMLGKGGKYEAASIYDAYPFTITAFNPSKKTMRISFKNMMLDPMAFTSNDEFKIKNLYIARFEPGKIDYNFYQTIESGQGAKEGTHVDALRQFSDDEHDWATNGEEITLDLMDGDFENTENRYWWYFSSTQGNWGGQYNFSECLTSPDYREGMECQIIYYENVPSYRPVEVKEVSLRSALVASAGEPTKTTLQPEEGSMAVKAPDTGVGTRDYSHGKEMPWWITMLMISGVILLIWWVFPTKYTKIQKKSKKREKRY